MRITKRARKISNLIIWIVVILLLVTSAGFIYKFTDGFKTNLKTFYVEYDGDTILEEGRLNLFVDKEYRFEVKRTLDFSDDEDKRFNVKIYPYVTEKTDFTYTLDGVEYLYSEVGVLTDYFNVEVDENGFSLKTPYSVKEVLKKKFTGQEINLDNSFGSGIEYFRLEVTSEFGDVVNIYFTLNFGVDKVVLDKTGLVF